jgi:hypothetical protein
LKSGKDSSYIDELEFENKRLKKELEELKKDPFRGMSLKKLAEDKLIEHWKGQIRSFEKKAKAAIFARDVALSEANRLRKLLEEKIKRP